MACLNYPVGSKLRPHKFQPYSLTLSVTKQASRSIMEAWHGSLIPNAFGLASVLEGISPGNYNINIVRCSYCNRKEFEWRPDLHDFSDDIHVYTCSRCSDQRRLDTRRYCYTTLFRHLNEALPPLLLAGLFDYAYPLQLTNIDTCKQRINTMRFVLYGKLWTSNWLYDLHKQLEQQTTQGYRWNRKR